MAFPETLLPLQVDLSLDGATWTDVSSDVLYEDRIQITRGRRDWGQQVDAGRCSLAFKNGDGKYSPQNPESPLYGQIGRNTPIRVSVSTGSVALDLPGGEGDYASTPDTAALDITGDIDIRVDATLVNWCLPDYPSAGETAFPQTNLIGKDDSAARSWVMSTYRSRPYLEWSSNGSFMTNGALATADLPLTTSGRITIRVTIDADNGAGGHTVTFYTAPTIDGPWTQLGDSITDSGSTSIHAGTAPLRIGDAKYLDNNRATGLVHAAELRSGIDGTIVTDPDFTAQTSGTTSFADSAGLTWTIAGNAEVTNRKVRFVGEVASWIPRWDTGGDHVVTQVDAAGVLRRLGVGSIPTKSPMYREFTSPGRMETGIHAYWPMEDGTEATKLASAMSGHPPMSYTAGVTLAAYDGWVASQPVPTITSGSLRVSVPPYTRIGSTSQVGFFCRIPEAGTVSTQRLVSWSTTGTAEIWSLYVNTSGALALRAYDEDATQVHDSGFGTQAINGREVYIIVQTVQDLGDSDYEILIVDIAKSLPTAVPDNTASATEVDGTVTGYTPGIITQVRMGEDAGMNGTAIGHLTIGRRLTSYNATGGALVGWNGEEAPSRVSRLGIEESIHSYATGPGDEQCGTQPAGTALDVMRGAGDVDEGILAEQRSILGIRYVTRASMYNQPPTLVLDYTGDDGLVTPLEPVDDDQSVTNDVTVARTNGSSARLTQDTGPLSTQQPPDGIGLYDTSATLNLLDDDQPLQHAGWRLHLGTWDETRFPQVTVNLATAPHMIEDAAAVDTGSRIQITNPPAWLPPDTIDLLVQGYTETLDQFEWKITYNCTPARPLDVAWTGAAATATSPVEFAWLDTDGSQLAEALDTTETAVDVYTISGYRWTPYVADTPLDWRVGGEVMTVTAPGGLLNANPFFDSNITSWTGENATLAWSQDQVNPHPRAAGSLLITPDGTSSTGGAVCDMTSVDSITPGAQYVVSMWVYSPGGSSDIRPSAYWYTNAGSFDSTAVTAAQSAAAGVWTYMEETVTAPATAGRARARVRHGGTPSSSDVYYVWAARITRVSSSVLYDRFGRTAASSWGRAGSGAAWSTSGGTSADFNVTGGYGAHRLASANVSRRSFTDFPYTDFDAYVSLTPSATATGGFLSGMLAGRYVDSDNMYMARLAFNSTGSLTLTIRKRVTGTETELDSHTVEGGYTAGTLYRLRFQASGSTLRAKAWPATGFEPNVWQAEVEDTSITTSTYVGLRSISASTNTNVNPEIRYDDFDVTNPQTYTVTRSQNGVTKTHTAGTAVALAYPSVTAL
ncbi:carbohydrate binding domain-containing protein [Streptomyces sp. NPDC096048]|uniref:carbohydrate binding domain-containing protein n=1 Tax=Streptomyces sp. NPDC096048 TaxID=3366072 RepID=UPI0037FD854C